MKKFSSASLLAIVGVLFVFSIAYALIGNGGFETGDYSGWTKSSFLNDGFSQPPGAGGADLSTIVTGSGSPLSSADPRTNGNLLYPAYGDYTAKVNNEDSWSGATPVAYGKNGNRISQTYTAVLDPGDGLAHVRFAYAAVMVDPSGHTPDEKPYFRVQVINNTNGGDIVYDFSSYAGEPGKNWQTGAAFDATDDWVYLDWTYVDLKSSPSHPVNAGDSITIIFTAAGCSPSGHPGYVYVDEVSDGDIAGPTVIASGPSTIPTGTTITYTYDYFNGSSVSIDPTITVTQPAGVTFTSVSDAVNCALAAGTVTCNFTGVGAGTGSTFTIDGTVTASGGSQLAHGDYYISATGFPTLGGQTVFTDVTDLTPDLSVTASGPASLKPGDNFTYTFNYTTDMAANNTEVAFTLPSHTTYVSDSGTFCSEAAGVVTCNLGTISANGSFTVTTLVDKLKKIGTSHILNSSSYHISADGTSNVAGSATVTASVLTPFIDVNVGDFAINHIQSIWAAGITSGCAISPLAYCPNDPTTRADIAIYIERGVHGGAFNPGTPPLTFTDTATQYAKYFIEALKSDGITGGCGPNIYCPGASVSRAQIAVLLLRGKHGSGYNPPAATGTVWLDVTTATFAAKWAEQIGNESISVGCGGGNFCPNTAISRAETAVLVQRTFNLPLPTP